MCSLFIFAHPLNVFGTIMVLCTSHICFDGAVHARYAMWLLMLLRCWKIAVSQRGGRQTGNRIIRSLSLAPNTWNYVKSGLCICEYSYVAFFSSAPLLVFSCFRLTLMWIYLNCVYLCACWGLGVHAMTDNRRRNFAAYCVDIITLYGDGNIKYEEFELHVP